MKRCLILGGSGALGGAVCQALAQCGARVALTYCTNETTARAVETRIPGAVALKLDLRCLEDVARVVRQAAETLGGLSALISCAAVGNPQGSSPAERVSAVDEASWDRVIDVNVKGVFFTIQRAMSEMRSGEIVLVGSIDGVKPVPTPIPYATSKAALDGMTRALAKALGPEIRVNIVHPGVLESGLSREIPEDLIAEYKKHCASKRLGRVEEVASVLAWLALDNTYLTGQSILIDGGL